MVSRLFLAQGGDITYVYQAVSYGWNGTLPLGEVASVAAQFGDSLALLHEPGEAIATMDEATRNARVRPVWQPGFAGNTLETPAITLPNSRSVSAASWMR